MKGITHNYIVYMILFTQNTKTDGGLSDKGITHNYKVYMILFTENTKNYEGLSGKELLITT